SATSNPVTLTVNPAPDTTLTAATQYYCPSSSGNTASVPSGGANAGATFVWSVSAGATITAGQGTSQITYTAPASGNLTLTATVTTTQGCAGTATRQLSAASPADADLQLWSTFNTTWQDSTFNSGDHNYTECGVVPARITLGQQCAGNTWSVTIDYAFLKG